MKRSKRLRSILDLIITREEEVSNQLDQARQRLEKARHSLSSLHDFRANYTHQFNQRGEQGMGIRQMLEYRAFLAKINAAMEEQEKVIHRNESEMERLRQIWEQARRKTLGVKKVLEKSVLEENRRAEKILQSEMDEWASRKATAVREADE
ncbi:flagellar export protein FliJ [Candidatus Woesearchaeota archaeon]|nr:flagellar export protein FliJ [Candidatus Woesearchaeota archaeon]